MPEEPEKKEEVKEPSKKEAKALSVLEQTKEAISELDRLKTETALIVEKALNLKAENMLSGDTPGATPPPEKKVESNSEYADRIMAGNMKSEDVKTEETKE